MMKRHAIGTTLALTLACGTARAQSIASVEPAAQARSARIVIKGGGFGAAMGTVTVGGVNAPVTQWADGQVNAYVPEAAALGAADVVVRPAAGGESNAAPVTVNARPAAQGRIQWKFQADDLYLMTQPAVGPDGTVYVVGALSHLYALTPDGGLKWVRNNVGAFRAPSVAADGTVYITDINGLVTAVNPDGSTRWSYAGPANAGTIWIGPNVGPDGNIYGVCQVNPTIGSNFGAFAVSPQGQLLWNTPNFYNFRHMPYAWEVVFGRPATAGEGKIFFASGMGLPSEGDHGVHALETGGGEELWRQDGLGQVTVAADGNVYTKGAGGNNHIGSYTPGGQTRWTFSYTTLGAQPGSDLGVAPDGSCFMTTNTGPKFNAINGNGSFRYQLTTWPWKYTYPNVRPDGNVVVVQAAYQASFGTPSQVRGLNPQNGASLWSVNLDTQGEVLMAQVWAGEFRPDGAAIYVPTTGNNYAIDPWCYLYAITTTDSGQPPATCYANCDGSTAAPVLNVADFTCFLSRFAAGDAWANCDQSTAAPVLNVADFTCFLSGFAAGCP
jgi:hypothetical protein